MKSFKFILVIQVIFIIKSTIALGGAPSEARDSVAPILPTRIKIYSENQWNNSSPEYSFIDTTLNYIHRPDPVIANNNQNLGNLGSPYRSLQYHPERSIFQSLGLSLFDPYLLRPKDVKYWRTNKRFTELNYHMGAFREQRIEAFHSQNILTRWNAGIDFKRFNVQDFTPRSDTYYNRFNFFTDYNSTNGKYHLYAHALWNTIKLQTNGGITDDSLFSIVQPSNLDLKGISVRLQDAGVRYRENSFHLGNYYCLNNSKDSTKNILEAGLSSTLSNGSYAYFDQTADSTFYQNFYLEQTTDDSLRFTDLRNRFSLNLRPSQSSVSGVTTNITLFAEHQYFRFWQRSETVYNSLAAGSALQINYKSYSLAINGEYIAQGDLNGNYQADGLLKYSSSGAILFAGAKVSSSRTPVLFELQDGNHFRWNNAATNVSDYRFYGGVTFAKYQLGVSAFRHTTDGFYYMDQQCLPAVSEQLLNITGAELSKNFKWRKWGMENKVNYQHVDRNEVLRLPEWSTRHSLFWERSLYRNTFVLRAGVEARYMSEFRGDQFMPATGFFYLQDSVSSANVLLLDVFVNVKIKTAAFFAKFENIGNDIVTNRYYLTPLCPQPGMVFKFGVRWQFFDQ
jgi:hypothetical protein